MPAPNQQDLVHGLDRGGSPDRRGVRAQFAAAFAGTRRQKSARDFGRRRFGLWRSMAHCGRPSAPPGSAARAWATSSSDRRAMPPYAISCCAARAACASAILPIQRSTMGPLINERFMAAFTRPARKQASKAARSSCSSVAEFYPAISPKTSRATQRHGLYATPRIFDKVTIDRASRKKSASGRP